MDFFANLGCEKLHATMRLYRANNCFRASPLVLNMWPCKSISHIQCSYLLFLIPPVRLKKEVGTTNGKQPWPIIMIGQSKTGRSSQIIFIILFSSRCTSLMHLLLPSAKWANLQGKNHFSKPNLHIFTFLHLILMSKRLIRSTSGDALNHEKLQNWETCPMD